MVLKCLRLVRQLLELFSLVLSADEKRDFPPSFPAKIEALHPKVGEKISGETALSRGDNDIIFLSN